MEPLAPDEELVAGRRPVEEVFRAGRPARRLLVVPHRRDALERIVLHATNLRIPIVEVEGGTLTALAGFDGHQGVAVVVEPRRWATLEDVLARAIELDEPPFVLALDSLEDPHNLGTLLRSAEAAGVHGVLFPTHRQAPLSPSAVKASAGAVEHLLLCPVDDLPAALADLHIRGLRVAGAEADAPLMVRQADLRGPLAIVVGSEGQGLGPAVRRRVDILVRIPMRGTIDSLNAAVAGSILVFEALAQRDPAGTSRPRPPRQPPPRQPVAPAAPPAERETPVAPAEAGESVPAAGDVEATESPVGVADETPGPGDTPGVPEPMAEPAVVPEPAAAEGDEVVPETTTPAEADPDAEHEPRPRRKRRAATDAAAAPSDEPGPPARRRATRAKPKAPEPPPSDRPEAGSDEDLLPGGPSVDAGG